MIKQAPLAFTFLWGLGAVATYLIVKRIYRSRIEELRSWLNDREQVIAFLQKKVPTTDAAPAISTSNPASRTMTESGQLLPPVLELVNFDFEGLAKNASGFYVRASGDLLFTVAVLDFSLKPISGAVPWTEVQPQIRFKDSQGHVTVVGNAIWYGYDKPKIPLRYGVTASLLLASRSPKRDFRTYERDTHRNGPLERQLVGDVLQVEVRLVAEYLDDPKASHPWYFQLVKGDVPKITKSTQEDFERILTAT